MNKYFQKAELRPIYTVFFILVIAFACLTYFHELAKSMVFVELEDFDNYYFYSKAIWSHYNIYTMDETTSEKLRLSFRMPGFVYPAGDSPPFFFLIKPLTIFDFASASKIWAALNSFLLFCSVLIILKLICEKLTDISRNFIMASSLFMVFSFQPLIENLHAGQNDIPILFFFVLALYFLKEKRLILSGIMLSLGIIVKPSFGLILPFFLWKRCYRTFFAASISLVLLELLPIFLYGKDVVFSYWTIGAKGTFLSCMNSVDITVSMVNHSLLALANRMGNLDAHIADMLRVITVAFSIILFLYAIYITRKRFKNVDMEFILEFSLILTLIFIVFPVVHEHHYILLYVPIMSVWAKLSKDAKLVPSILFVIAFYLSL